MAGGCWLWWLCTNFRNSASRLWNGRRSPSPYTPDSTIWSNICCRIVKNAASSIQNEQDSLSCWRFDNKSLAVPSSCRWSKRTSSGGRRRLLTRYRVDSAGLADANAWHPLHSHVSRSACRLYSVIVCNQAIRVVDVKNTSSGHGKPRMSERGSEQKDENTHSAGQFHRKYS